VSIPQRAKYISVPEKEKSRALRKITVSTHSLRTLTNARRERSHISPVVITLSRVFFIFTPMLEK